MFEPLVILIQSYPKPAIIIISIIVSLFISVINYFFLNKERMHEIKRKQKELQAQIKEHTKAGNHQKAMELNKEVLSYTGETLKHSFKPMLITLVPFIIFFPWLRTVYSTTTMSGSWFWWYLGTTLVGSQIFRKLFKLP